MLYLSCAAMSSAKTYLFIAPFGLVCTTLWHFQTQDLRRCYCRRDNFSAHTFCSRFVKMKDSEWLRALNPNNNGRLWNSRWQQTYQVNVHWLHSSEHTHITENNGFYLVKSAATKHSESPLLVMTWSGIPFSSKPNRFYVEWHRSGGYWRIEVICMLKCIHC